MTPAISASIRAFNQLYKLPVNTVPTIPFASTPDQGTVRGQLTQRLTDFMSVLREEVTEGDEIIRKVAAGEEQVDVLTDMADWLGDITIYCLSEMTKFGLNPEVILSIIMASNMRAALASAHIRSS